MTNHFGQIEVRIISALYRLGRWTTMNEVAAKCEPPIAWNTAKKNFNSLNEKGVLESKTVNKRVYWRMAYIPETETKVETVREQTPEEKLLWEGIEVLNARIKRLEALHHEQLQAIDWRKEL